MNDELEVLAIVVRRLEGSAIPYMLSGSMALNHYAQPRMTRDIDLVVDLAGADPSRIVALFDPDFAPDLEEIAHAISARRMFNLIHVERVVKVDMVVRKETPYRIAEFARRRRVDYASLPLWIVSPEDLLLSKLDWAKDSRSDFQLRDVRSLIQSVPELDWPYIDRWAVELGLRELLQDARR